MWLAAVLVVASRNCVLAASEPAASTLRLREFYPPADAVVDRNTVLSAALDYSIADNQFSTKTYFVHALFNGPDGKTFNVSNKIEDGVELRQQAGVVLVKYPLKRVWNDKYLAKPVTVRFSVLKRVNKLDETIIAETEPITYRLEP